MQQLVLKEYKTRHDLVGEGDPLGTVQEIEIWPYEYVVHAQPRIRPGEWDEQISLGFWDTNGSSNLGQTTIPRDCQHTWDKYRGFARENLWKVKVTAIPVVIGALGAIPKRLIKGLEDLVNRREVETAQITALLWSTRILRRVQETWGDLLSLKLPCEIII